MAATWNFVLATRTGTKLGEILDAQERICSPTLQATATASFKILATNPILDDLVNLECNLLCYRNNQLIFHGPIISVNLEAPEGTATPLVGAVAADPSWFFAKRVMDRTSGGTTATNNRLSLAESIIGTANTDGEMGVQTMGYTVSGSSTVMYGPYRKLNEIIDDLANTIGGFDWRIAPIEYSSAKIGQFLAGDMPAPGSDTVMGYTRSGVVFEYEGRDNMRVPNWMKTKDTMANTVYSIPDDGPASPLGVRSKTDSTSITSYGLYADVADTSNIAEAALRDSVLDAHIAFRKNPRQLFTFTPDIDDGTGRVPDWITDYNIGDFVRCRFKYNTALLIDGYVRIYKMDFNIDQSGQESLTPTLSLEGTS